MKIPPGHTEETVLEAIERASDLLAPRFSFGYYDEEDVRQECYIFAIELLQKDHYDPSRPLANYIWRHLYRRLCNLKRDKLRRADPPCRDCHEGHPCQNATAGHCPAYRDWKARNDCKANLARPLDLTNIADEREPNTRLPSEVLETAQHREIMQRIDAGLPVELRVYWNRMRAGCKVAKHLRRQVEAEVRRILGLTETPNGH